MLRSTPNRWRLILRSLAFVSATAAALAATPPTTSAQQNADHSAAAPRHHVAIARGAYRPPSSLPPARGSVPMQIARPVAPSKPAYPVHLGRPLNVSRVIDAGAHAGEWDSFRGIFFEPPRFGAPFPRSFGLAGSVSQFGDLPLGFGLWPACDSASTPGRFWTVGPCFGLGAYSAELTPTAAQPAPFIPTLTLFEGQPPSGPAAEQPSSAPSPPTTMILYLKDGRTISATDWWVSLGRLQYITDSGQTGAVDVMQLDLARTNEENHKRGLDFRLKFTPPSDLYPPSIRP